MIYFLFLRVWFWEMFDMVGWVVLIVGGKNKFISFLIDCYKFLELLFLRICCYYKVIFFNCGNLFMFMICVFINVLYEELDVGGLC